MKKDEFIIALCTRLAELPAAEVEERVAFYCEMIDDRMEDGCSEEDAVAALGSVEEIATRILEDIPLIKIVRERIRPKRRIRTWEIVLLAVGSPLWITLLVAFFAVALAVYAVLWSVVISFWAVFASLAGVSLGGALGGGALLLYGNGVAGAVLLGGGLACAGLAIFAFFGCKAATKGSARLTRLIALGIKKCFIRKESSHA